jgi:threonine aldolase
MLNEYTMFFPGKATVVDAQAGMWYAEKNGNGGAGMVNFSCDYNNGAHPRLLQRFLETNDERLPGYGADKYSLSAKAKIRQACGQPEAEVELLAGGTQTNALVISSMLREYEGVIAADTGHISGHEAGAVEYTGHKVLQLPGEEGKLTADRVREYLDAFDADRNNEHMVRPGMVYISHPTEYGTLYTKAELTALSRLCRSRGMPLFLDGARLGYGLMSPGADVSLADVAALCDVFYIGGTKVGALCGEAVVFAPGMRPPHFTGTMKRHGALLAKGRLVGLQFDALFTDGLYFDISSHAIRQTEKLKALVRRAGLPFYLESPTNQQFLLLTDRQLQALERQAEVSFWERVDADRVVIRLAVSWATTDAELEALGKALAELPEN